MLRRAPLYVGCILVGEHRASSCCASTAHSLGPEVNIDFSEEKETYSPPGQVPRVSSISATCHAVMNFCHDDMTGETRALWPGRAGIMAAAVGRGQSGGRVRVAFGIGTALLGLAAALGLMLFFYRRHHHPPCTRQLVRVRLPRLGFSYSPKLRRCWPLANPDAWRKPQC